MQVSCKLMFGVAIKAPPPKKKKKKKKIDVLA